MKRKSKTASAAPVPTPEKVEAFTFGDPVPVLDRREILDYLECWRNGRWYEPPVNFGGLSKTFRASPHHSSAIYFKANILASTLLPHPAFGRDTCLKMAIDFLTFGNTYAERLDSMTGKLIMMKHALAKYTRRGVEPGRFFFLPSSGQEHEFRAGTVCQLMQPDINQEIYGLPEYLAALNAAWLNESATLFRRKYYLNGSHAGFIMYVTDTITDGGYVDDIREAMKNSKGPGNFRNLFVYAPGGKKDGLQIIPVSEVAARDDFFNIKNVSRDDVLAAHRVPPQLMGLVPTNSGGFGTPISAAKVFARNELEPLQAKFLEINDWLGDEVVRFKPYMIPGEGDE
ncbi:phage portal protein [Achromobacter xylosoxidans]|uniref:phage portal protein n=1 Tax=Alcaligenes xylosoxydans xylosoxydans TaxID=85698 RepID=UPI003D294913